MAQAFVIVLEKDLPEAMAVYTKGASGKALFRESARIDSAARRCSVAAINAFLSESQAGLIAQMVDEGFDPTKMRLPPEQWFDPREGLKSIRRLSEWVTANLNDFKQPNPIIRDLKAAELLLVAAEAAGVKFHFINTVL